MSRAKASGACFNCGQQGHWARECRANYTGVSFPQRASQHPRSSRLQCAAGPSHAAPSHRRWTDDPSAIPYFASRVPPSLSHRPSVHPRSSQTPRARFSPYEMHQRRRRSPILVESYARTRLSYGSPRRSSSPPTASGSPRSEDALQYVSDRKSSSPPTAFGSPRSEDALQSQVSDMEISPPIGEPSIQGEQEAAIPVAPVTDVYDVGTITMNMCRIFKPIYLEEDLIRQICSGGGPLSLDELAGTPFSYVPLANLATKVLKCPAHFDRMWCLVAIAALFHPLSAICISNAKLVCSPGEPLSIQARKFIRKGHFVWELFGVSDGREDNTYGGPLQLIRHDDKPNCRVISLARTSGFLVQAMVDIPAGKHMTLGIVSHPNRLNLD